MFLVLYLDAVRGNGGDKAELSSVFTKLTVEEGRWVSFFDVSY